MTSLAPDETRARPARTEIVAGLTTFLATAYIVVVNPSILSDGAGMPFDGVLTATVLLSALMTMLMGVYARLPFAVAPGMGLNAFFAYTLVLGQKVPWPTALGMIFWAGVLFLVISATPVRERLAQAIPASLRTAMACGIGLLITLVGLKGAGIIVGDPVTLVKPGPLTPQVLLAAGGLALTVGLMVRGTAVAFLVCIAAVTAAGLGHRIDRATRDVVQPARFHVGDAAARPVGRARPGHVAGDHRRALHRSLRLAQHVHRRRRSHRLHRRRWTADPA